METILSHIARWLLKCLLKPEGTFPSTRLHQSKLDNPPKSPWHVRAINQSKLANEFHWTLSVPTCLLELPKPRSGIFSSQPFCFKMIFSTILISLFASAVLCSDVIELGDSDFSDGVKGQDIMLVEFFAPWYVCTISYFRLAQLVQLLTLSYYQGILAACMQTSLFLNRCGHCKRLAPEYETAATSLKKEDPPIPLAKVGL